MRILHFLGALNLPRDPDSEATGGVTRAALELARVQRGSGHDVWVATAAPTSWRSEWNGVRLLSLRAALWARARVGGRTRDLRLWVPLFGFAARHRLDVVQAHEYFKLRYVPAGARIAHLHNSPFSEDNPALLKRAADSYWRAAAGVDAHIAVSRYVVDQLHLASKSESAPRTIVRRIYHVSNGVDHARFAAGRWSEERVRLRREWGIRDGDLVFLFAGAVMPQKGVVHLAKAFVKLTSTVANAHLVIAGGSRLWGSALGGFSDRGRDYETQVREILQSGTTAQRSSFLGLVSPAQMPGVYAASDAVVVPSIDAEAFGLVAAEALAGGRPVIASRIGGLPEIVTEANGILVPPADEPALLAAMHGLAADANLRTRLAASATPSVERLSWESSARQLDAVYEELFTAREGQ